MERLVNEWLSELFGREVAPVWSVWATMAAIALIAWLSYKVCVKLLIPIVNAITLKTENEWDDDLLNERVLRAASQLAPAILVGVLLPDTFTAGTGVYTWCVKLTNLYILWASIRLVLVFMRGVQSALDRRHLLRSHNLEILRQTVALFVIGIGIIVGVGILINRDPLAILAGFGASAAVLMLVFRDTILNFVAGIQLTVNKMLVRGDWVSAPKAGANGEVEEVKLTTIKIRNWDNSIVTIPPYTLVSDSFQNFQAMRRSGARRVARSVFIDQTTIRMLTPVEVAELQRQGLAEGNDSPAVNFTLLRVYMERYLANHPEVLHDDNGHPGLTLMARQLQPTPQGVPFELYFFTSRTAWKPYEHLQADVFDHLYTVIPRFSLAVYQAPTSTDFARLR